MILGYDEKYYGTSFAILNDDLYFLNYIPKLLKGNSHTYKLNLNNSSIEQID